MVLAAHEDLPVDEGRRGVQGFAEVADGVELERVREIKDEDLAILGREIDAVADERGRVGAKP